MKTEAFGGNFESYKKQFFAFNDDYPEIAGIIAPLIDEHTRLDEKLNHIFTINHLRRTKQVVIMKIAAVAFMILWAYPPWDSVLPRNGTQYWEGFGFIWGQHESAQLSIYGILLGFICIAAIAGIGFWLGEDAPIPNWIIKWLGGNHLSSHP